MEQEIFEKVAELIAANNDIPVDTITMDSTFEELNMDSLDGLNLVNDLENEYSISIPNDVAMQIRSVRQIVENLQRYVIPQQ